MRGMVFLLLSTMLTSALAGETVRGVSKDLGTALEKAVVAVEKSAKEYRTCVGTYPSIKTCEEGPLGYWICTGIRQQHLSGCPPKPQDLDAEIAAATGLSAEAARAAVAAGTALPKKAAP